MNIFKENPLLHAIALKKMEEYLKINPEFYSQSEKEKFKIYMKDFLSKDSGDITDEIYDFLVYTNLINNPARDKAFVKHIVKKYPTSTYKQILDVGAGRRCKTSILLCDNGYFVDAMDPAIKINDTDKNKIENFNNIFKTRFCCDTFSKSGIGTNIDNYDLIVGLEPCDATEHIIRQSLIKDKPFEILLCATAHKALSGEKFNDLKDWHSHLKSISKEVSIYKENDSYYASNLTK